MDMEEGFAKHFYEQCAGTYAGHMGMVPHNPSLFYLVRAATGHIDNRYAATQEQFAALLRRIADEIDS